MRPVRSDGVSRNAPYYTHQVIELPEIRMIVRHFVLHEACCPQCGRVTKAQVPTAAPAGMGPG